RLRAARVEEARSIRTPGSSLSSGGVSVGGPRCVPRPEAGRQTRPAVVMRASKVARAGLDGLARAGAGGIRCRPPRRRLRAGEGEDSGWPSPRSVSQASFTSRAHRRPASAVGSEGFEPPPQRLKAAYATVTPRPRIVGGRRAFEPVHLVVPRRELGAVDREALESSWAGFQAAASPSQLPIRSPTLFRHR